MKNFIDKFFHISERKSSLKSEIIGGLITFVAMCYILPVNASILNAMGMDKSGVFAMTAIVGALVTFIMGFVANYPVVLSAGMGLNAYLAYTICQGSQYTWQQCMILLTISGLLFFAFSLTPVRKIIIESIPKDIKYIISSALGAFICFVGLRNSGIVVGGSTLVELGSLLNPSTIIALVTVILCFVLMFSKNKIVSNLAIPICILVAAVAGVITSSIMIKTGAIEFGLDILDPKSGIFKWQYTSEILKELECKLPIAPWHDSNVTWGMNGVDKVFAFGLFTDYSGQEFGEDLLKVLTTPTSYVAIFSLMFVNLFDTTATLLAVGRNTGIIDENGKMQNYQKAVLADSIGAAVCGPLGTSTVTSFAESNVGVEMGAKTGFAAVIAGLMFLLSAFIYPVFSIFTAGSVTAPALVCVGAMIFVGNFKDIDFKDRIVAFTGFITVIFSLLAYSIATGIGIGLICYVLMMLIARRGKEVSVPIYIVAGLFVVSFALTAIMPLL
ncbi:MAG: NCS2 family permease [Erysipelotrichales bacterium]|nr:NCS2 family permease [Erysipelotrichales bacterium]